VGVTPPSIITKKIIMKKFFFLITLTVFTLGSCASINDHCGLAHTEISPSIEQQDQLVLTAE